MRHLSIDDLLVVGGLALAGFGLWLIHQAAPIVLAGATLLALGLARSR